MYAHSCHARALILSLFSSMAELSELSEQPLKKRLSLKRKKPARDKENNPPVESKRFASPIDDDTMGKAKEGVVPVNTWSANQWALRNFLQWANDRNAMSSSEKVPDDLLKSHDANLVCKWLCFFVQETRKEDGQPYPPRTLKQLLSGLKRLMDANKVPFNIFNRSNIDFRDFHMVCDSVCSDLLKQGIGSTNIA